MAPPSPDLAAELALPQLFDPGLLFSTVLRISSGPSMTPHVHCRVCQWAHACYLCIYACKTFDTVLPLQVACTCGPILT